MKFVTSHIMGIRLQDIKLTGLPFTLVPNTTLNELFNVQSGVAPDPSVAPVMNYLSIANGGHVAGVAADGTTYPKLVNHGPRDCALINHLPFVLRLPTNDLDPITQANYAMRTQITVGGINYIAYYLRTISMVGVGVSLLENTVANGITTSVPWVPTSANLHPTPTIPSSTGSVTTSGDYVSVQEVLGVTFAQSDIDEFLNVATILYGTPDLAIISEAALVAANPKVISVSASGGGTITYTEAVAATICSSMSAYYHLPSLNQSLVLSFDVGGAESLYGVDGSVVV